MDWIGIDYGAKQAGTTVICFEDDDQLHFATSEKKKDADTFVKSWLANHHFTKVFIDAPLSLPGYYQGLNDSFFYRAADRELKAMSPMFLGGLTARAMRLVYDLRQMDASLMVHEVYPGALIRQHEPPPGLYKKSKAEIANFLLWFRQFEEFPDFAEAPTNWHQVDSFLAWIIGKRFFEKRASVYGNPEEGTILV